MSNRAWSIVDIIALLLIPLTSAAASQSTRIAELVVRHPVVTWIWMSMLFVTHALSLGLSKDRGILGVLVSQTNRVSLARFQGAIWGALLMTAIAAAVAVNVARGCSQAASQGCRENPLAIALPFSLLAIVSIAAVTVLIASWNDSRSQQSRPRSGDPSKVLDRYDSTLEEMIGLGYRPAGIIAAKLSPESATLGDLVRGELVSTYRSLDLARIQFMILSLVLGGLYAVALAEQIGAGTDRAVGFPEPDWSLVALFALSAGVYLGSKLIRGRSL
jgi:hypothetical protein